jgi:two-component system, cell cycle response regulator PopA
VAKRAFFDPFHSRMLTTHPMQVNDKSVQRNDARNGSAMAKPQILVLADSDAALALTAAGFSIAGDDATRRQTSAIIIETRGEAGAKAGNLARSIKAALGPRAGLFMAWADATSDYDSGAFDGSLDSNATPIALAARLNSSLRIAVMADEAQLRFKSLARFGGAPKPPTLNIQSTPRILVFGPPGPDMMRFTACLEARGAQSIASFTSFTAFDYLHDGDFDGVAIIAHDDVASSLGFCSAMRRNARLFHMPCLVLGSPDFSQPEEAINKGATDFAVSGDDDDAAAERLLDFVDEKRSRDALALAFAAARAPAAMDQGTGLYAPEFFTSHLETLVARAHQTDRPLSITLARIAPDAITSVLAQGRGLDRIVGQAGAMMARLVRAEDVAARMDRVTFGVAFPSSDEEAAHIAATRIGAVLECTAFDSGSDVTAYNNDAPLQIKLNVACAVLLPGESAHSLIARAQARLPLERL